MLSELTNNRLKDVVPMQLSLVLVALEENEPNQRGKRYGPNSAALNPM